MTELRNAVRQSGGEYVVVKNTLALRAIDGQALAQLKEHFAGPTAVVFSRTIRSRGQGADRLRQGRAGDQVQGRPRRGRAIAADQIKDIASLPSREELIAKLLFLLQSPITRFGRVLAAVAAVVRDGPGPGPEAEAKAGIDRRLEGAEPGCE